MNGQTRSSLKMAAAFAAWCAVVALRAMYTRPYEFAWFVGIGAAFLFAATCGYIWRGLKPGRDRRRLERARGRL